MKIPLRMYWSLLANYLRQQRLRVGLVAILLLSGIGLQLVNPQILRFFIDTAQSGGATQSLLLAALLFIGVAIGYQWLTVLTTYLSEHVGWTATNALRSDLALHCLRLDPSFHKERSSGELIERIDGDASVLANFFSQFVIQVLGNLLLLLGVLLVLALEDWRVAAVLSVLSVVVLLSLVSVQRVAVPHWQAARQASADQFGFIAERLAGTEDIRSSGAADYTLHKLYHWMRERLLKERKASVIGMSTDILPQLCLVLSTSLIFTLGYILHQRGAMTTGTVYMVLFYTGLLFQPLMFISNQLQQLQQATAAIIRVQELFQTRSAIQDGTSGPLPAGPLSIEFDAVTFGYDPEITVLDQVSFQIRPGQVLGVLGRTGSGKTTLTRLLLRLYDVQAGQIRIGGIDIRDTRRAELRRRIGMVTQDVQIFHASVRDNLSFFDPSISDERILAALSDMGLGDWYRSLPRGLDTMLASGEFGLSAGEAQLLAFTRVFLKDPGLVILDEASSRLDPVTQSRIEQAVDKLLADRSGIVIAHRLATVERADQILILEHGQIREYGQRMALLNDQSSRFSELLRVGLDEVLA
jgi:ATP-binding cassette, subfamily B, bacterial